MHGHDLNDIDRSIATPMRINAQFYHLPCVVTGNAIVCVHTEITLNIDSRWSKDQPINIKVRHTLNIYNCVMSFHLV